MKNSLLLLTVLLVMILSGPAEAAGIPAGATGAPDGMEDYPPPPPAGASIFPAVADTQVRMMAETVQINAAQNDPGEKPHARVQAVYTMRNLGSLPENVEVRFPLNFYYPGSQDWRYCGYPLAYPEIGDFGATVDGQPAQVTTLKETVSDPAGKQGDVAVACYAGFPVTFPPRQDVKIETRYTVPAFPGMLGNEINVQFKHVLASGADWNGSIGSAEVIFHAPYMFNAKTLLKYYPERGLVNGSEIRWKFTDFEPDNMDNITAALMDPAHWQWIQDQTRGVADNPQDGVIWGRLAGAYHKAVKANPTGWRADEGGYEMYARSATAYARAVTLLPDDVEMRYGYAELLIWNAFYPSFGGPEEIQAGLVRGVDQLRRALKISPDHIRANALLKQVAEWPQAPQPIVDVSGPKPVYLILTPAATTYTPVATETRTPFPPSLTPSPTWTRAPSRTPTQTATVAQTLTPPAMITVVRETEATPERAGSRPGLGICGAALAPGMFAVAWVVKRRKGTAL